MDKLQVFISWSGARSHAIAKHVKAWLPDVVRNAEPWLSSEDLQKGLQWLPELNKILGATSFGLLVLTAENKDAPWLVFEAGVISKSLPDRHCCPLLCDLKSTDVSGPLAQFQATTVSKKEDMLQLVKNMNDASEGNRVDDERLNKWFVRSWEEFEKQVSQALASDPAETHPKKGGPTERELLEEVLASVRRITIDSRKQTEEVLSRSFSGLLAWVGLIGREFPKLDPKSQELLVEGLRASQTVLGGPEYWEKCLQGIPRGILSWPVGTPSGLAVSEQPQQPQSSCASVI